jgi:hypothetical protein
MRASIVVACFLLGCGYPDADEVFGAGNGPATPAGAGAGGGEAGSGGATAGPSGAGAGSSSGAPGATTTAATGPGAGGTGGGDPSCDADGDGHPAMGDCGGDDCDDAAADAYPGQDAFFAAPRADGSFDWNCDGDAEPETPTVACSGALGCGFAEGDTGFEEDVPCGEVGKLGSCGGIPCTFDSSTDLTQRCR